MKIPRLLLAVLSSTVLSLAAFAADPSGTWKWSTPGRDGQSFESTLKLELKDEKLTGTMLGIKRGDFNIPDTAISDASIKGDVVTFSITREFNGNKFTSKYESKLDGDTIKGASERPGQDGATVKRDWLAKRAK